MAKMAKVKIISRCFFGIMTPLNEMIISYKHISTQTIILRRKPDDVLSIYRLKIEQLPRHAGELFNTAFYFQILAIYQKDQDRFACPPDDGEQSVVIRRRYGLVKCFIIETDPGGVLHRTAVVNPADPRPHDRCHAHRAGVAGGVDFASAEIIGPQNLLRRRMATISPWAVESLLPMTMLCPAAMI